MTQLRKNTKIYPVGTMFGYLKIIGKPIQEKQKCGTSLIKEHCKCMICGKEKYVLRCSLKNGRTKTCGGIKCVNYVRGDVKYHKTHGMTKTRPYHIYIMAKQRCKNKNNIVYQYYGGRGIDFERKTFEDFWKDMGKSYLEHVKVYGEKDTTIERIDSNKNYCKKNCKWATYKEQQNNRRGTHKIEYKGKTYKSISSLCDEYKLNPDTVRCRINKLGWDIEKAINYNYRDKVRSGFDKQEIKNVLDLETKLYDGKLL